jgi:hypothetical protein
MSSVPLHQGDFEKLCPGNSENFSSGREKENFSSLAGSGVCGQGKSPMRRAIFGRQVCARKGLQGNT